MSAGKNINPPTYTFDEPIGTITVTVLAAEENDSRRLAPVLQGRVRLDATVTVRAVAYRVFGKFRWENVAHPVYAHGEQTGEQTHWREIDSQYTRLDSGKRPDYQTATYRTLHDTAWRVLGKVATEHPEWQRDSFAARLRAMASEAEQTAASARHQWMEASTTATELRAELAAALAEYSREISGTCLYCGSPLRYSSIDPSILWVHTRTGNGYCDVDVPEDAVMFAGTAGRTEATPLATSIRGEQS